jgi:GMP synthase (glutamine-hydrolysing)
MSLIVILDCGSQYTELIARRVRELQVYCEVWPFDVDPQHILDSGAQGVIVSGSYASVYDNEQMRIPAAVFQLNVPVLGICYGMQSMAEQLGGQVLGCAEREFGLAHFTLLEPDLLFADWPLISRVWMSHGDQVKQLPPDFKILGSSENTPIAAMRHLSKPWYGVQFHPETTQSEYGTVFFERFLFDLCGVKRNWSPEHVLQNLEKQVLAQVRPNEKVLLGLSGGVDSLVLAVFLQRILQDRLICVFVDTGLLRDQEAKKLSPIFAKLNLQVLIIDAAQTFFANLQGVSDPELKRKTIGRVFIEEFALAAQGLDVDYLAQGTIYSDVIESAKTATGKGKVIKSHHNVGGLPDVLPFKLLEPFRTLFKDEVRALGRALGLEEDLIMRHPFPGPGLGVRILGEVTPEFVAILQRADHIFLETLKKTGWYQKCSQAFAVFLPVQSVGVMGDGRRYDYVISLRAVETIDFMTATPVRIPFEVLEEVASRIVNEVPHVSRVVYDITGKPPATIEWE